MTTTSGRNHGALHGNDLIGSGIVKGRKFVGLPLSNQDRITDGERRRHSISPLISALLCPSHGLFVKAVDSRIGSRVGREVR